MRTEIVAMARVAFPEPLRHQHFNRLPDQLLALVAEHFQRTRIYFANHPPRIGYEDRVGTDGKVVLNQNLGKLRAILPRLGCRVLLRGI